MRARNNILWLLAFSSAVALLAGLSAPDRWSPSLQSQVVGATASPFPESGTHEFREIPTELHGQMSINRVKIGMTFDDVESLFDGMMHEFTLSPAGATLLQERLPDRKLRQVKNEIICFGITPGTVGCGNFTQVWFDDSGRASKIQGVNLEKNGRVFAEETWANQAGELRLSYPVFASAFEQVRGEYERMELRYPDIGLTLTARTSGPYHFELGEI